MATGRAETAVGVAVAGLGAIGRLHARNLVRHVPAARVVAVVDQLPDLAREAGEELGVPWSTAYEAVLGEEGVDAVVIATPTPTHAGMVEDAARAGKHVFCEKPLSLHPEPGERAARLAKSAGLGLQVGFQRRFDPDWVAAKRRMDAGEVGDVYLLRVSHRNMRAPHGRRRVDHLGSLFVDMSIHDFDSARWLAGEVSAVSAFATSRSSAEFAEAGDVDNAVIVLEFASGALGLIDNTRVSGYGFDCAMEAMGRRSTLRIGGGRLPAHVEQLSARGLVVPLPADHLQRHRIAYLAELRHFVACVQSGSEPDVGAEDALAALRLSLAAERSHLERRRIRPGACSVIGAARDRSRPGSGDRH